MHAFTQRLIRAARASTARSVVRPSCAGSELDGSALPDVWWFRPDGRRMTAATGSTARRCSGCSSTAQAIPDRGPQGEPIDDDSFVLLFNAHAEDREFMLPRRADGRALGARAVHRRPRPPSPAAPRYDARDADQRHRALDHDPQARADSAADALRATYRLQLTPDFGFAAAAGAIPYLRDLGVSHLYLSPSLQARHRIARTATTSSTRRALSDDLGGEAGVPRAGRRRPTRAGLGIVLDIVPNHMATDDANRFWTDPELRARFFDIDPATGRHRRFFDIDDLAGVRQEDPAVFEETHAPGAAAGARGRWSTRLRIDHPDGLARSAAVLRAAARRRCADGVDREDPRVRRARCATGR